MTKGIENKIEPGAPVEDPRRDLARRLLEYERMKKAAAPAKKAAAPNSLMFFTSALVPSAAGTITSRSIRSPAAK